ncbi:MAG: pyruvate kinase [Desulfobacterales bacterium]|jgi:pyruvate kinase
MPFPAHKTKIVCTIGPASDSPEILERMIRAGMNIARLNFSHGDFESHAETIQKIRAAAKGIERRVAIMADLPGPKMRIGELEEEPIELKPDDLFTLTTTDIVGNQSRVSVSFSRLHEAVKPGDNLFLNDGLIEMAVMNVAGHEVQCKVLVGGQLRSRKGLNLPDIDLGISAFTDRDHECLKFAMENGVDAISQSFVETGQDIHAVRKAAKDLGHDPFIIAKLERISARDHLDDILEAADGIMIARGDLGVEIGDAEVPAIQKQIIGRARSLDKPVITATQMMESMISSPVPTRAEVSDVANAVVDGTDTIMLSGETAVGKYPDKVITADQRICLAAERQPSTTVSGHRVECRFERVDEAISMSAMYAANHLDIKVIVALTESGSTPLWMSHIRTAIPIFALSRNPVALGKMTWYRNVYPLFFDVTRHGRDEIKREANNVLESCGWLKAGDMAILIKGDRDGVYGGTNSMKIVEVGQVV